MSEISNSAPMGEDFYRENEELLKERRKILDKVRNSEELKRSNDPHWMKCPKCGEKMNEFRLLDILLDQCEGCNGLFFDNGELETLLEVSDRRGFFNSIKEKLYN